MANGDGAVEAVCIFAVVGICVVREDQRLFWSVGSRFWLPKGLRPRAWLRN